MASSEAANANESIHANLNNLKDVSFERILCEDTDKKIVFVEGRVKDSDDPAVLIIEKLPWKQNDIQGLLSKDTSASQQFNNDIYGQYSVYPPPQHNSVKLNLVHPATQKHIEKYLSSPGHLIQESPDLYHSLVLPHIQAQQFSLQWVYNVLEHKKEVERIIFEDPDPETGFILAPDFKWSGESVSDLYCLAIIHKRGVKSLRDLNKSHLFLLRNIKKSCLKAVKDKYGLKPSEVRMYFHYQPSYYHLHVHVTSVHFTPPGSGCDKSHLLDSVISNIEIDPCHYQKATLSFMVREKEKLFGKLKESGYFDDMTEDEEHPAKWFTSEYEKGDVATTREFLEMLGQAKHEPCGEFWETTYGESAWRMCVMVLCLDTGNLDRERLIGLCLASSLTSLGTTNDENTEWAQKISDVTQVIWSLIIKSPLVGVCMYVGFLILDLHIIQVISRLLPPVSAAKLAGLFEEHALVRRGKLDGSKEHTAYRGVLEMEELLLRWEEEVKEGKPANEVKDLLKKMVAVKFPGWEQFAYLGDPGPLTRTLKFWLTLSKLQRLRRTGWIRCGVREPETVAGHMFR